jgi:hypothetical protein
MKLVLKLLLITSIVHAQNAFAQHAALVLPETEKRISLRFEPTSGAQGNFRSIHIDSEGRSFHFVPRTPIARIPETSEETLRTGLWDKVSGLKLDISRYFFHGEYSVDSKPHTLLFFVSEAGASDAGPLFVLGFSTDGTPYKVLERDEFDLYRFQSTGEGSALIIGKATMSQVMGGDGSNGSKTPYATTYDPFSVFVVHGLSQAQYSLSASAKYNQAHYVWAGPHSREDYAVIYNLPGHPNIMGAPASRVDALLGGNRSSTAR